LRSQQPQAEAAGWNDLEEMYSFDLCKVEDMITKVRAASAAAGAKELEEQYSFDLAKVEDLVSKNCSDAKIVEEVDCDAHPGVGTLGALD